MKSILITGITSGIGNVALKKFLDNGFSVTGVVRNESQKEMFVEFPQDKLNILIADLSIQSEVEMLTSLIAKQSFDYVLLNAGCANTGMFHELSSASIEDTMRANVISNMHIVHELMPGAIAKKTKFVFVSSLAARLPAYRFATYAASKAALSHFANSLRREYPTLDFLCIEIGAVNTPLHDKSNNECDRTKFKSPQLIADRLYEAVIHKTGVETLSWDWTMMRKISMVADQLLTNMMVKKARQ